MTQGLGRYDRDFSGTDESVVIDIVSCGEAEEACFDRSERHLLQRWVVADVAESPRDGFRPVRAIRAGFEAVAIHDAAEHPVVTGQVGEAGNPLRTTHVDRERRRWRLAPGRRRLPQALKVRID